MKNVVIITVVAIGLIGFMIFGYCEVKKSRSGLSAYLLSIAEKEKAVIELLEADERIKAQKRLDLINKERAKNKRLAAIQEKERMEIVKKKRADRLYAQKAKKDRIRLAQEELRYIEEANKDLIRLEIDFIMLGKITIMESKWLDNDEFAFIETVAKNINIKARTKDKKYMIFEIKWTIEHLNKLYALKLVDNPDFFSHMADGEGGYCLIAKTDELYRYKRVGFADDEEGGYLQIRVWKIVDIESLVQTIYHNSPIGRKLDKLYREL